MPKEKPLVAGPKLCAQALESCGNLSREQYEAIIHVQRSQTICVDIMRKYKNIWGEV